MDRKRGKGELVERWAEAVDNGKKCCRRRGEAGKDGSRIFFFFLGLKR